MPWHSPEEAMPWVGLYAAVASLVCTLAMAADAFQGFRQRKLWFPCRFFTIDAASLTLMAIAMKLPLDLTTNMSSVVDQVARIFSISFLLTMLANFLPSLGRMSDKEILMNTVALGILMITVTVNVCIEVSTGVLPLSLEMPFLLLSLLWLFSLALTVPTSRRILELKYQEMHKLASSSQGLKFSREELIHDVKKYWTMAETGNHQFVIACSPICSASGVICSLLALHSFGTLEALLFREEMNFGDTDTDYKWSIHVILVTQAIAVLVGGIAPIFRCFTAFSFYELSRRWSMNHLNVFRVEKYWTQRLSNWKHSRVGSNFQGCYCEKVVHNVKNFILSFVVALQIIVVVISKAMRLIPNSLVILFSCCRYFCKSLLRRFKIKNNASSNNVRSEIEEHTGYVLQVEEEVKLSKRILRNTLKSITRIILESEKKEPSKLIKLLEKSTGFNGVAEFDNDQVPPLHLEETLNCWSLVAVTLTAIAVALPNIANGHVKELQSSVSEGLQYVRHIEESLNANGDLVNTRKAATRVWTELEVYCKWLQLDLQKKACRGKTSQDILQWLGNEGIQFVIQFKRSKNGSLEHTLPKFIAASSMYRISRSILLHCNEQENWPNDEELFEWISTMIADILCACFTNLPQVITMKCHESALEKREESIRTAAQLLGKTKKILNTLQERQLPNLDLNSMAYIDEWHALLKSQNPFDSTSSSRIQPASSGSNESLIVTVV